MVSVQLCQYFIVDLRHQGFECLQYHVCTIIYIHPRSSHRNTCYPHLFLGVNNKLYPFDFGSRLGQMCSFIRHFRGRTFISREHFVPREARVRTLYYLQRACHSVGVSISKQAWTYKKFRRKDKGVFFFFSRYCVNLTMNNFDNYLWFQCSYVNISLLI